MDNQHKKISGYRDLSQEEIDLVNEGKALAERYGEFVSKWKRRRVLSLHFMQHTQCALALKKSLARR